MQGTALCGFTFHRDPHLERAWNPSPRLILPLAMNTFWVFSSNLDLLRLPFVTMKLKNAIHLSVDICFFCCCHLRTLFSGGSRIFLRGSPTRKVGVLTYYFTIFLPKTVGARPWCPPPIWIRQCSILYCFPAVLLYSGSGLFPNTAIAFIHSQILFRNVIALVAGSFRVRLFIESGGAEDLGKRSGCSMIIRWTIS